MCSTTMAKLWVLVALCFVCFLSFGFCVTFEAYKPYARTGEMIAESTDSARQIPAIHAPTLSEKYGTPDTLETHASYEEELTIGTRTGAAWTEGQEGFPAEVNLGKVKESVVDLGEVDSTSFKVFENQPTDSLTGELSSKNTERPKSSSSQRSGTKFNRASKDPPEVRATTMSQTSVGRVEVPSTVQTEVVDSLSNETDDSDYPETTFNSATESEGRSRLSEKLHMAFNPFIVGNNPNRFFRIWNRKSKTSTQPTGAVDQASNDNDLTTTSKAQSPTQSFQQEFTSSKTSSEFEDLETDVESSATTSPASSELPECSKCSPEEQLDTTFESSTSATEATTSVEFLTTETTSVESLTTGSTRGPTTTSFSTTEIQESSEDDDIDESDDLLEYGPELWQPSSDPGLKSFPDEVTRKDLICTEIVLRSCLLEHLGLTFIDPENMTPREINRTCHHRFAINSCVRMGHKICNRNIPLFTGSYAVLNNLCRDRERHIKYMDSLPNRKRVSQPELERCMQALECQFMNITIESGLEKHFEDIICIQFCHSLVWVKGHVTSLNFFEYCQHRLVLDGVRANRLQAQS